MNWYKKASMEKTASKFVTERTFKCGHCGASLAIVGVNNNPHHHFNPGQHYACPCGKSQVWCNSVRKPQQLIEYCDGSTDNWVVYDTEQYGFCNDTYCPFCWTHIQMLEMGVYERHSDGQLHGHDIYGCPKECCPDNKKLIEKPGSKDGEFDGQLNLAHWYREHQNMWRHLIETGNKPNG